MTRADFVQTVDDLQMHISASVTEFFRAKGIEPNWTTYLQNTSTDFEQSAREVLFYAGDMWPGVDEAADTKIAA